jgi:hypothetical protein
MQTYGYVFSDEKRFERVADLVLGSILKITGQDEDFYFVQFPDGRTGLVDKKEAMLFADWLGNLQPGPELIEKYSDAKEEYYRSLKTFETFGKGWLRRVAEVKGYASEMLA